VKFAGRDRPPSIRDFYAFEEHVATARRARGLDMEPEWYERPAFYFSNPSSIIGDGEQVRFPASSIEWDYELEVACVVGSECRDVPAEGDAWLDVLEGFTILDDFSARDLQRAEMRVGLGPAKGKDFATALGPEIVPAGALRGVGSGRPSAAMVARINGAELSRGELADIHFSWPELIAHASRDTVLLPGDVIGSGTVGTGCLLELRAVATAASDVPPPWLRSGDVVELEVDGLGILTNTVA
jgi:fumarylacetoacetate (FAA) hydrolase